MKRPVLKYIVLRAQYKDVTVDYPFIFPGQVVHSEFALLMQKNFGAKLIPTTVVGAGFCNIDSIECFGESETLQVKSRDGDADLIMKGK